MTHYRVRWEIDVEDDISPKEAAERARAAQLRPNTTAVIFDVTNMKTGAIAVVDLLEEEGHAGAV